MSERVQAEIHHSPRHFQRITVLDVENSVRSIDLAMTLVIAELCRNELDISTGYDAGSNYSP